MTHRERSMSLLLQGLLIAAAMVALGVSSVAAAPDNKNTYTLQVTCPAAGGTYTMVIVNPNSSGRHLEGTNGVLVLASVVGEVTIDGMTFPLDYSPSEQRFEQQELTTCFIQDTFILPRTGQAFTVDLILQVILTPRSQ